MNNLELVCVKILKWSISAISSFLPFDKNTYGSLASSRSLLSGFRTVSAFFFWLNIK